MYPHTPPTPDDHTAYSVTSVHIIIHGNPMERERERDTPSCGAGSYLRVSSVVVLFSVAAPDKDPHSTQPCPPTWARMWEWRGEGEDQIRGLASYLSAS